jgi:CDP-diacylglycerol pyrophosphatase
VARVRIPAQRWPVWGFALAAAGLALTMSAAFAVASDRAALWQVVRSCVADKRLTGLPFPCLAVDLTGGEARGHVVLRPPWANDMILTPTRQSVGIEDPFLQSPEAPNYFAEAWRTRTMIATTNDRPPARDQVALVVNSRPVRGQDQLHIHIGCLVPEAARFLAGAAAKLPPDQWRLIGPVVPHQPFWALRVRSAELAGVEPFRLVRAELGGAVRDPADLVIAVVGATVMGNDEFLILASYNRAPGSWWPVGAENLIDQRCRGEAEARG